MTDSLFKITPTPPTSIKLEPGHEGKLSFTAESLAAPDKVHGAIAQALLVGEDGKGKEADWLEVSPKGALGMTGGETKTITVTARPKPTTPRGEHGIKLVIADKDRPNDVYADSPAVVCEVLAPASPGSSPRKIPWWLIAVIAGGLLVIGGAVVLIVKLAGGGPSGPPDIQLELLRDCTKDGLCGPDQKCAVVQPGLKRCVWQPGHACSSGAECSSKWCNQRICTRDDGKCETQRDCPSPYLCIIGKQRCLIPNGQVCGGDAECDSGFCSDNRCAPSRCVPPCRSGFVCNNNLLKPQCVLLHRPKLSEQSEVPWRVLPGVQ